MKTPFFYKLFYSLLHPWQKALKILPVPLEVSSLPAFLQASLALLETVYIRTMMTTNEIRHQAATPSSKGSKI